MKTAWAAPCEKCAHPVRVSLDSDGAGRMVERLISGCEHERKRWNLCRDCPASLTGRPPRAKLCAECLHRNQRRADNEWRARNPERTRAAKRAHHQRKRNNPEEREREKQQARVRYARNREKIRARERRRRMRPEVRERDKQRNVEYEANHVERLREYRRQYRRKNAEKINAYNREARVLRKLKAEARARLAEQRAA
jgi:hypothetical protein